MNQPQQPRPDAVMQDGVQQTCQDCGSDLVWDQWHEESQRYCGTATCKNCEALLAGALRCHACHAVPVFASRCEHSSSPPQLECEACGYSGQHKTTTADAVASWDIMQRKLDAPPFFGTIVDGKPVQV